MSIVDDTEKEIRRLQSRVRKIQADCSHPKSAVTKKHGANTGNYDPSCDCYWTDFNCSLCKKRWTKDGSL